ncbi:VOC family protein [Candidatus Binatus sp.]|uniref:VOC family protein n=1 Tax=Candidatus Binatus sp. TaxID=2811406 RepID=UPI002F95A362
MANPPIGKLDHIGIAVKSLAEARKFFEDILGASFMYEGADEAAGFKLAEFDLGGLTIELLEPLGPNSFLHKFLEKRGEGMHHLTFNVPDCKSKTAALREQGVRIVDETQWSPTSFEAFISPRAAHGVLIQLGSGYPTLANDPAWLKRKE